jgi:hypothetical protein
MQVAAKLKNKKKPKAVAAVQAENGSALMSTAAEHDAALAAAAANDPVQRCAPQSLAIGTQLFL